jgi:tetratricopeptide (TPR) repeat protein
MTNPRPPLEAMPLRTLFAVLGVVFLAVGGCGEQGGASGDAISQDSAGYTGSESCRECHEKFYQLWSPSRHGLAMQPFTETLAATLVSHDGEIAIGEQRYRAEPAELSVVEKGPDGENAYPIQHALGGKNVYYFLTPLERGHLQVLPIAYDVRKEEWFDTAGSALRMFPDIEDDAVHWTDRQLTFNTSCHGCHVSQLATNYDPDTDSYETTWAEPGINCETCHGPAGEHVRVFREAPEGTTPADVRIIRTKPFTVEQNNALCAPCHAKMRPVTTSFRPGERYFDHFDLVTLEHLDFYPDGRDLGENYTYTSWRMSPCVPGGELDCLHCHTSSGRYRFGDDNPNEACAPCHRDKVDRSSAHTHHGETSEGNRCIACHMPRTVFARMERHDHSMRPPMPAATLAHESPNACNLCHDDQDAAWADGWVRKWRERDYQAPVLHVAGLVAEAREGKWSRLPEMLAYIGDPERDEVFANSLIRLLRAGDDDSRWPAIVAALGDPSPLVRATAAEVLGDHLDPPAVEALLEATGDEYRLVRVRAAAALAALPPAAVPSPRRANLERALAEFQSSLTARPDDHASHYNMGNFLMARQQYPSAIDSFETAVRLRSDFTPAMVNAAMAYNIVGRNDAAERSLRSAIDLEPKSVAAWLNLGLLLAEQKRYPEAADALRITLDLDPGSAVAAYNLCVLLSAESYDEAIPFCRQAAEARPADPKYAFGVAYFERNAGNNNAAIEVLDDITRTHPTFADAYMLLGEIHEEQGRTEEATAVYRQALEVLPPSRQERAYFHQRLTALGATTP